MIYPKKSNVFYVKTFKAGSKNLVANAIKKTNKAVVKFVDLKATLDTATNAASSAAEVEEAINLLKSADTFFYCNVSKEEAKEICSLMGKLDFRDFIPSSFYARSKDGAGKKTTLVIRQKHESDGTVLVKDSIVSVGEDVLATYAIVGGTHIEFHLQFTYTDEGDYVPADKETEPAIVSEQPEDEPTIVPEQPEDEPQEETEEEGLENNE